MQFIVSLACALSMGTGETSVNPSASITTSEIKSHIEFLASDELEGRDSGQRGGEIAARYIESRFKAAGLKPLFESYRMPFDLGTGAMVSKASLTFGATIVESGSSLAIPSISAAAHARGRAASASAADVLGCVVVLPGGDQPSKAREQAEELAARGAAGVVFVSERERMRSDGDFRRRSDPRPADQQEGGGALFEVVRQANAMALTIPVVRVAKEYGEALSDAVVAGDEVDLNVQRTGSSTGFNIIGWREGSDPALKNEYVVIGAHYDHVGTDGKGRIWNGADDNASGTAAVLEVADALALLPEAPRRSLIVVTWSGEERGLLGSNAFAAKEPIPFENIAAYVNLDMVGRNDNKSIDVGQACQELFDRCVERGTTYGLSIGSADPVYLSASDTLAFVEAEVPTIFFFSGMHDEYHTPADQVELIDADKTARVARLACDMLLGVANADGRPKYTAPARTQRAAAQSSGRRLGVFIDEEFKGPGLRIQTVSPDSLAQKSGLKDGDVVMKVAGRELKSRDDLRKALELPKDGESFVIEVARSGAPLELNATFATEKKEL
ncbi:MAG: M20/M25/M40 family metallo-hydrolase [Planctomycetes bacterium]|nr:M20/M25/M40 family metallo-hydrolase [Planctomycetota bacterium]